MMFTGGIDAELGNSALVGLPVGTEASCGTAAAVAAAMAGAAFQADA
jgi:hypothetical protein